jgi:hypothetical protein
MNCRANQWAWINVPRTRQNVALGIVQIHGHVVFTKAIHPDSPAADPQWIVEPPQRCVVPRDVHGRNMSIEAGTVVNFQGVPDSFLRPFEDLPPELFDEQLRVVADWIAG